MLAEIAEQAAGKAVTALADFCTSIMVLCLPWKLEGWCEQIRFGGSV